MISTFNGQAEHAALVSVIRDGIVEVTEEMKVAFLCDAQQFIESGALDLSVGLFAKEGHPICNAQGLSELIEGMSETVTAKVRYFGDENLYPGDILVTSTTITTGPTGTTSDASDKDASGDHKDCHTFTLPVFDQGELMAFVCCRICARQPRARVSSDPATAGFRGAGVRIPMAKYHRAGKVDQDLADMMVLSAGAWGDPRPVITTLLTGKRHFLALVQRFGRDVVHGVIRRGAQAMAQKEGPQSPGTPISDDSP